MSCIDLKNPPIEVIQSFHDIVERYNDEPSTMVQVKRAIVQYLTNQPDSMDAKVIISKGWEHHQLFDTQPRDAILVILEKMNKKMKKDVLLLNGMFHQNNKN